MKREELPKRFALQYDPYAHDPMHALAAPAVACELCKSAPFVTLWQTLAAAALQLQNPACTGCIVMIGQ